MTWQPWKGRAEVLVLRGRARYTPGGAFLAAGRIYGACIRSLGDRWYGWLGGVSAQGGRPPFGVVVVAGAASQDEAKAAVLAAVRQRWRIEGAGRRLLAAQAREVRKQSAAADAAAAARRIGA